MDRGRFRFEGYELDLATRELGGADGPIDLERQVFDVLAYLVTHRDRVVPRVELLDSIWGDRFVSDSALSSRIKSARRAVGDDGDRQRVIRTVRGVGFRFVAQAEEVEPTVDPPAVDSPADESPAVDPPPVESPADEGAVRSDGTHVADTAGGEEVRRLVVVIAREGTAGASAEDLRSARDRLADDIASLVDRFGGRLQGAWGGEVVVLFGIPAHDDDGLRARSLAEGIVRRRPQARVAVGVGEVVVSVTPEREVIAGDVLAVTQRLMASAQPGVVALSDAVQAMLSSPTRDDLPLVGRRTELRLIADLWERVVDDGTLRVLEVSGEAGIGKSRLVRAAVEALDPRPAEVLELAYSPFALPATAGLIARISADHRDVDSWLGGFDLSAAERSALAAQLRAFVEAADVDAESAGPGAGIVSTFVRLVQLLARSGPIVVILEDIHWATSGIVPGLADAALLLADRPVLAILTSRPQPQPPALDLGPAAERSAIRLGPLQPDELIDLATSASPGLDRAVISDVAERGGGSPLFVLQYLRMLDDDEQLGDDPPDSVRLVISARLDHLTGSQRQLIQAAAVLQQTMRLDGLTALTGVALDDARRSALELVRAGLLRPVRGGDATSLAEHRTFEFDHAVVGDVAYAQLTRDRRIQLHRQAARWLELEASDRLDDVRAEAWHWRQVIDLTRAARRPLDDDERIAARRSFERAGDRLLHVDVALAIRTFEDARALTVDGSPERAAIELRLGVIHTDAGTLDAAQAWLERAAAGYDELDEPARAGEALARLARPLWYVGDGERLDELLGEAIARFERTPPGPSHAVGYVIAATQAAISGDARNALELVDRAMPMAERFGTQEDVIRLLHARGMARFDLDDPAGVDDLQAALDSSLQLEYSRLASQSYNNLAELLWMSAGPERARSLAVAGIELAEPRGLFSQVAWHRGQLAELDFDVGAWDDVLEIDRVRPQLNPMVEILVGVLAARVRFWRGDDAQLEALEHDVAAARATRTAQIVAPALAAQVSMCAELGRFDAAADAAAELLELTDGQPYYRLTEGADAVRGLLLAGRPDLARRLVPADRPRVLRRALMWDSACAAIAEHEERWDDALDGYRRAEAGWLQVANPYEGAHAALGVWRAGRARDERTETAVAERARQWAEQLRAVRLLGRGSSR